MATGQGMGMINAHIIDQLMRRIQEILPPGAEQVREDLNNNLRAALSATLSRMDLVSREEFDVQSRVLARTREKLEKLEEAVAALERAHAGTKPRKTRSET